MARLHIPASVVEHWEPKFEDLARHGVTGRGDASYAKVRDAAGKRKVIDADAEDLAEFAAECASQLDDDTDVAGSSEPEYRRFRTGYRKLRADVLALQARR